MSGCEPESVFAREYSRSVHHGRVTVPRQLDTATAVPYDNGN